MSSYLTLREQEIATLVASGASNKQIAKELAISIKTVKNILTQVFVKTNTCSRTELAIQLLLREDCARTSLNSNFPVICPHIQSCPLRKHEPVEPAYAY